MIMKFFISLQVMKRLVFVLMFLPLLGWTQSNEAMRDLELSLKPLVDRVFDAPTDNERFGANERLLQSLGEILTLPKAFSHPFEEISRLSILKSDDNRFRVFTWAVVDQDGFYENFGFLLALNQRSNTYEPYRLYDKSDEIFNPEIAKCDDENWFGAVYYDLITTYNEGRVYYTLLGYNGNDIYSKKRVIEPISFRGQSSKPEFGLSVFFKERDRRRYIFEYNPETNFVLKWDSQYYERKIPKKSFWDRFRFRKKKERPNIALKNQPPDPRSMEKEDMIVYEVLEPLYEGMEDMFQFYVGSGVVNGFKFERGRWRLVENILPRNPLPRKGEEPIRRRSGEQQPMYDPEHKFKKINQ